MIEAVLFDMDGTLIEFNYDLGSARMIGIARLLEMGVDRRVLSESKPIAINIEDAVEFMRRKGFSEDELKDLRRKVYEAVEAVELKAAEKPVVRSGVSELLSWLKEREVKTAVCTNNCKKAVEIVLETTGLKKFFNDVFTRNDVDRLKPFPDLILKACEKLGVHPWKTVHVGDSPIDIEAAVKAGVKAIGMVSSLGSAERLRDAGAEMVVLNPYELWELLSAWV
ncbi:MAG: HAD family phosphatase [Candidatus Brockarchaeota archaeon]|nr:HAD family phosphatase [Candidatus Brockarchaeota archaeon]